MVSVKDGVAVPTPAPPQRLPVTPQQPRGVGLGLRGAHAHARLCGPEGTVEDLLQSRQSPSPLRCAHGELPRVYFMCSHSHLLCVRSREVPSEPPPAGSTGEGVS